MIYKIIEQIMSEKEHLKYCHFMDKERLEQDVSHFRESEHIVLFDIVENTLNYAYKDDVCQFIFDRIREIKSIDNLEELAILLLDEELYIRVAAEIRAKELLKREGQKDD